MRTSLWLIPSFMLLIGAAVALAALSPAARSWIEGSGLGGWLGSGSGEDARNLLSTLLSAVIAMASIAFSVTVVALSLAANTYGPRLIRIFRSDHRTQVVLGIFVMTIVYILIVLRNLRGEAAADQVPAAAVTLGALFALSCVLALLAFIQGVASLMAADEVVLRVRNELDAAIGELEPMGRDAEEVQAQLPGDFEAGATRIALPREGYVQAVDYHRLCSWAKQNRAVVRLEFRPGDFVVEGDRKVAVYPAPADPARARIEIDRFIVSGERRTPTQDIEFAIRHLVEVAVRALSPGINDPFTAMAVIDRLRGAMVRLAARRLPRTAMTDEQGEVRILRDATTYTGALDAAFNQIRQAGSSKPSILIHLLKALGAIAQHAQTHEQRLGLRRHADLVRAAAQRDIPDAEDRDDVERAFRAAANAF